ncbi:NAD(P)H-binding protein [Candidatus Poribacteria bacterium]|nr:NAD(P)H-binding protein [Candidatus Poribacteria bacterium]
METGKGELHAVTGAFGYSGRFIARYLLDAGHRVRTLTRSPDRENTFAGKVEVHPYNFEAPGKLAESLRGARVLYNTYWVRFNHRGFTHAEAVRNTKVLFDAAAEAGVGRIVHVSITNPSLDSPFEYFRGKAELEDALRLTGIPHTILRPAVLFGGEDILLNNIAWALRKLPVFGVFGDGAYKLQPIHVEDFARLAVNAGNASGDSIIDATGPETFAFRELVRVIRGAIGCRTPVVPVPAGAGHLAALLLGMAVGDVMLTREEIGGLMAGLLATNSPPAGTTRLTDWLRENGKSLGRRYASELARRSNRRESYRRIDKR